MKTHPGEWTHHGYFKLLGGWNGGELQVVKDGLEHNFSLTVPWTKEELYVCLRHKGAEYFYEASVIEITGYDSDHGHEYHWRNLDIVSRVWTTIGVLDVSLRNQCNLHPHNHFQIYTRRKDASAT